MDSLRHPAVLFHGVQITPLLGTLCVCLCVCVRLCSRKAILGMSPIHLAHQTVSAKALVELGFEEAMRLGLVWRQKKSCPLRVTRTGEAFVWVVMGASSEKGSFGLAVVAETSLTDHAHLLAVL